MLMLLFRIHDLIPFSQQLRLILNTRQIALLHPLDSQSRNERRTNTRAIFGGPNLNGIFHAIRPIQNLPQRLRASRFEMRVLVEDAPVGADVAGLDVLLLADGGDAARGESGGAGADELGQTAAELEFGLVGLDAEAGEEEIGGFGEVLEGVFLDHGEEGGVERVGFAQLGDVLTFEHFDVGVVVEADDGEAEDLAKVEPCYHFLEGLLAWARGVSVDDDVVGSARENDVFVVECAVFAIDGDGHIRGKVMVGDLGDGAAILHVCSIASGAEDTANAHQVIRVRGCDQRAGRVVDQGCECDWQAAPCESLLERGNNVFALHAGNVKAFSPTLQDSVINVLLSRRIRERKA